MKNVDGSGMGLNRMPNFAGVQGIIVFELQILCPSAIGYYWYQKDSTILSHNMSYWSYPFTLQDGIFWRIFITLKFGSMHAIVLYSAWNIKLLQKNFTTSCSLKDLFNISSQL